MFKDAKIEDLNGFGQALEKAIAADFGEVVEMSLDNIIRRGQHSKITEEGGTPYDTGLLMSGMSSTSPHGAYNFNGEAGYVQDYGLFQEVGFRMRNGRFFEGRKFLYNNKNIEEPILFKNSLEYIQRLI